MKENPKILFVLPNFCTGGSERVVINIIRSLDPSNFNIFLIVIDQIGELSKLIPNHVKLINLDIKRTRNSYFRMLFAINSIKPNLIFSSTNRTNILLLALSKFLKNRPKILIREPNSPYAQFGLKKIPYYYLILIKLLYSKATLIIAQTDNMKMEINKYFNIRNKKILVITNPIDYNYIDNKIREEGNPYSNKFINVVASGRLAPQKGYDYLIRSFKKVVKINDKFRLHILGRDTNSKYKNYIESLISELDLSKYIFLKGFQENPYIYYKHANLFVLSSIWEGLPNVVLESLYLRTPVVVTNCIPFFKDIIIDGRNGYIVEMESETEMTSSILKYKSLKVLQKSSKNYDFNLFFKKMLSES